MVDAQRQWDEVEAQFQELGRKLKGHFRRQRDAEEAPGDEERVQQAVRTLADALDRAVTGVGDAVRDPGFRHDAGKAAESLGAALGAALSDLGHEISGRFGRTPRDRPGDADGSGGDADRGPQP